MTMNSSGAISLGGTTAGQSIAIENGGPGTAQISLNDTAVRSLAGVPGAGTTIIMPTNFYGKSNIVNLSLVISSNTQNYDVWANASASPSYVAGKTAVTVTVNPGIVVGGPGGYAMLVPSSFNSTDTVTIVNSPGAYIVGAGGAGGTGAGSTGSPPYSPGSPGGGGGNAIYVNRPTTITNNGTIGAGGGGGGGGGIGASGINLTYSGGGGGGGAGNNAGGGAAAGPNNSGSGNPGSPGSTASGGGGGTGATVPRPAKSGGPYNAGSGGSGGGLGASGASGGNSNSSGGGGGGSANYITGNPFVTWPVGPGTVYGGVA